ncbi:hypothetical protein ABZT03_40545 [Streptomyces sp. NPDC005574]|uniref:hypothetical protein n=1 Tax=Streptomyces sp. NPDC005574 TaxID=3156891 RepID=UPI0033AF5C43
MSTWLYVASSITLLLSLATVLATPFLLAHSRSPYDHGSGCWWCHPRLPLRRH